MAHGQRAIILCIVVHMGQSKRHSLYYARREAAHVFTCVGPLADDSHFLFDFAAKEQASLLEIDSRVSVTGEVMSSAWRV
jgi:hypothetical protein